MAGRWAAEEAQGSELIGGDEGSLRHRRQCCFNDGVVFDAEVAIAVLAER
jgi:hypothetical protein